MATQIPEGAKIYLISISVSVSREFCQVVFSPNKAAYTNITGCVTGGENCIPSLPTHGCYVPCRAHFKNNKKKTTNQKTAFTVKREELSLVRFGREVKGQKVERPY